MRCTNCKKTHNEKTCPFCGNPVAPKPPMKRWKKWAIGVSCGVGGILLALVLVVVCFGISLLGKINRVNELEGDIGVNSALPTQGVVQNIALFGLDTQKDTERGRSDAIIILSIDRVHNKIKLTSFARDSLVPIDGHNQSKLTHAFWWGGASLAVKTLNQNFAMNITDYAYVNFFEFAELIDYIGGVELDVNAGEMRVMNTKYIPELNALGISCTKVTSTGKQHLTGGQVLAYSRDRYTGSELDRGNRHKEVLEAMYAAVKDTSLTKYPAMIGRVLERCHTSLSNDEMLDIATWAITKRPSFEQFGLPSLECHAEIGDRHDGYGDVVRYDLDLAADLLYTFIYEKQPKK